MKNCNTVSQPIYVGSRFVGKVEGDTFYKNIKRNHYLTTPPALALSVESLIQAERAGAIEIEITDQESGYVYFSTISHFRRYAFDMQRGGFEAQKALPLSYWTMTHTDMPEGTNPSFSGAPQVTVTDETEPPKYSEVQLSLFDEQVIR